MLDKIAALCGQMLSPVGIVFCEHVSLAGAQSVSDMLKRHFASGDMLQKALRDSIYSGIDMVTAALTGPGFARRHAIREFSQKFHQQILSEFLRHNPQWSEDEFIRGCVADLQKLRSSEWLQAEKISLELVAECTSKYAVHDLTIIEALSHRADSLLVEVVRNETQSPFYLARLLNENNVICAAASLHLGMRLREDPMLFRAFWAANQRGVQVQLGKISQQLQQTQTEDAEQRQLLLQQLDKFQQLQAGIDGISQDISVWLEDNFEQWRQNFGGLYDHFGELQEANQEIIEEILRIGERLEQIEIVARDTQYNVHQQANRLQQAIREEMESLREEIRSLQRQQRELHDKPLDSISIRGGLRVLRQLLAKLAELPIDHGQDQELFQQAGELFSRAGDDDSSQQISRAISTWREKASDSVATDLTIVDNSQSTEQTVLGDYSQADERTIINADEQTSPTDLTIISDEYDKQVTHATPLEIGIPLEDLSQDIPLATDATIASDELSRSVPSPADLTVASDELPATPAKVSKEKANPSTLQVGDTIDRYEIIDILGKGGMGVVYRAYDPRLKRETAIKLLLGVQDNQRFLLEAQTTANLRHPNIVAIYDMGEFTEDSFFLVMEYIEGTSLAEEIKGYGAMPVEKAIKTLEQVACALKAAHEAGIIHRDIKPANIMLTADGNAKVADFGLAKVTSGEVGQTMSQQIVGTPMYMSPEQIQGLRVDGRSDVYSLGITLYQMLSGKLPFEADSVYKVIAAHLQEKPVPIEEYNPDLPHQLVLLTRSMMAREITERLTAAQVLENLKNIDLATPAERSDIVKFRKGTNRHHMYYQDFPRRTTRKIRQEAPSEELEIIEDIPSRQFPSQQQLSPQDLPLQSHSAQDADPDYDRHLEKARHAEQSGQWSSAVFHYRQAQQIESQPQLEERIEEAKEQQTLEEISALIEKRRWQEAHSMCQAMLEKFPGHLQFQEKARECHRAMTQKRQLIVVASVVAVLLLCIIIGWLWHLQQQSKFRDLLAQAQTAREQKRWQQSERLYEQAKEYASRGQWIEVDNSRRFVSFLGKAQQAKEEKNWTEAINCYRNALKYTRDGERELVKRAKYFAENCQEASRAEAQQKWKQASRYYEDALSYADTPHEREFAEKHIQKCLTRQSYQEIMRRIDALKSSQDWERLAELYEEAAEVAGNEPERADAERAAEEYHSFARYYRQLKIAQEAEQNKQWQQTIDACTKAMQYATAEQKTILEQRLLYIRSLAKAQNAEQQKNWSRAAQYYQLATDHAKTSSDKKFCQEQQQRCQQKGQYEDAIVAARKAEKQKAWMQAAELYKMAQGFAQNDQEKEFAEHNCKKFAEVGRNWQKIQSALASRDWQYARRIFAGISPSARSFYMEHYREQIEIIPPPKISKLDFALPESLTAGVPVHFAFSRVAGIESIEWHFGDGTTSKEWRVTHVYKTSGKVKVSAVLDDGIRKFARFKKFYKVGENRQPQIVEWNVPDSFGIYKTLRLQATAKDPEQQPLTYTWEFGDGTQIQGNPVSHEYSEKGLYRVRLTVSDGFRQIRDFRRIYINETKYSFSVPGKKTIHREDVRELLDKAVELPQEGLSLELPDRVIAVQPAMEGAYLLLQFGNLGKIGVYSILENKFIHNFDLADTETVFAAGGSRMVCCSNVHRKIDVYELKHMRKTSTMVLAKGIVVTNIAMGLMDEQKAIVSFVEGDRRKYGELSLASGRISEFTKVDSKWKRFHNTSRRDYVHLRVNKDATRITCWSTSHSPTGVELIERKRGKISAVYEHRSDGYLLPSLDGKFIFTGTGNIYMDDVKNSIKRENGPVFPVIGTSYYLVYQRPSYGKKDAHFIVKKRDSLKTVKKIDTIVSLGRTGWQKDDFTGDRRIFAIGTLQRLVQIDSEKRRIYVSLLELEE